VKPSMLNLFLHAGTPTTLPDVMSSEREESESCNSSMDEADNEVVEKEMTAEEEAHARKERRERRERLKQSLAESLRCFEYEERQLRRSIDSARREAEQVTTPMEDGQEGSPGPDVPDARAGGGSYSDSCGGGGCGDGGGSSGGIQDPETVASSE